MVTFQFLWPSYTVYDDYMYIEPKRPPYNLVLLRGLSTRVLGPAVHLVTL